MNLVTRCPTCGTAFRIQPAQLAARGGRVRCGKCSSIFDAVASLQDQDGVPARLERSPQLGLFDPSRRQQRASPDMTIQLDMSAAEPAASRPPPRSAAPSARPLARKGGTPEPVPEFLEDEPPPTRLRFLWAFLTLLALVGLAGQMLIHFRTELALQVPQMRPFLVTACEAIGCRVRLPRHPALMSIESSDLQAAPGQDKLVVLNAAIRNRASFPQEYPDLELTLTDENDRAVVRRVLTPAEYLAAARKKDAADGIASGAEVDVHLYFDTSQVRATGYRLYLFFP